MTQIASSAIARRTFIVGLNEDRIYSCTWTMKSISYFWCFIQPGVLMQWWVCCTKGSVLYRSISIIASQTNIDNFGWILIACTAASISLTKRPPCWLIDWLTIGRRQVVLLYMPESTDQFVKINHDSCCQYDVMSSSRRYWQQSRFIDLIQIVNLVLGCFIVVKCVLIFMLKTNKWYAMKVKASTIER